MLIVQPWFSLNNERKNTKLIDRNIIFTVTANGGAASGNI